VRLLHLRQIPEMKGMGLKGSRDRELALAGLPEGGLILLCGPTSDGGWRTINVFESEQTFERFMTEQVIPKAQKLGFPQPSKREIFEPFHDLHV
jgi:hypothetical protein